MLSGGTMDQNQPAEVLSEKILNAAQACFNEYGYDETTVDAISAHSGLPAAVIFSHFADKSEIKNFLLAMWSERLSAWITNA
jgi:AcrR family transcriptional regulator